MDKNKIIFIAAVVFIFFLLIMYSVSRLSNNKGNSASDFSVPDIVKKEKNASNEYENRLAKANQSVRANDNVQPKNLEFKTFVQDSNAIASDNGIIEASSQVNDLGSQSSVAENVQAKHSVSPNKRTSNSTVRSTPPVDKVVSQPVAEEATAQPQRRGGFGVVRNQSPTPQAGVQKNLEASSFYSVILEKNYVVKDNETVVFILLDDIVFEGVTFKKNSYAFGKASVMNHFFDVQIIQIKNTDNKIYDVRNFSLFVYDENYARGIKFEGNFNNAVKDGSLEGVGSIPVSTTEAIIQKGADISNKIVNKITQSKNEPTVSISKGYRVFLKTD